MIVKFLPRALLAAALLVGAVAFSFAQTNLATTNTPVTISNGNAFQTILSALTAGNIRRSITVQNNNTNTDSCWLFIGSGAATKGTSILLAPGGSYQRYYPYVPSDAFQATCTTTNDTMYLDIQ